MNAIPTTYAIRVHGHLDDHWSTWFGTLDISRHDDGTSTLTGPVADQAQLHGILAGLRDIGATLICLRTIDSGAPDVLQQSRSMSSAPIRASDSRPSAVGCHRDEGRAR